MQCVLYTCKPFLCVGITCLINHVMLLVIYVFSLRDSTIYYYYAFVFDIYIIYTQHKSSMLSHMFIIYKQTKGLDKTLQNTPKRWYPGAETEGTSCCSLSFCFHSTPHTHTLLHTHQMPFYSMWQSINQSLPGHILHFSINKIKHSKLFN